VTDPEIEYARLVSGDAAADVEQVADAAGASLRTGAQAVGAVVTLLESSATDYSRTDDVVGSRFRGLTPPQ